METKQWMQLPAEHCVHEDAGMRVLQHLGSVVELFVTLPVQILGGVYECKSVLM